MKKKIYVDGDIDVCRVYADGKLAYFKSTSNQEGFISSVCSMIEKQYDPWEYDYYVEQQGFGMAYKEILESLNVNVEVMKFDVIRL